MKENEKGKRGCETRKWPVWGGTEMETRKTKEEERLVFEVKVSTLAFEVTFSRYVSFTGSLFWRISPMLLPEVLYQNSRKVLPWTSPTLSQ